MSRKIGKRTRASRAAMHLSVDARDGVLSAMRGHLRLDDGWDDHVWAEAAGLLRDGWSPGDPVEVRR